MTRALLVSFVFLCACAASHSQGDAGTSPDSWPCAPGDVYDARNNTCYLPDGGRGL